LPLIILNLHLKFGDHHQEIFGAFKKTKQKIMKDFNSSNLEQIHEVFRLIKEYKENNPSATHIKWKEIIPLSMQKEVPIKKLRLFYHNLKNSVFSRKHQTHIF
jgi:hypothetical protein